VITSTDNPRVKEVVRLRQARARRQSKLFIAEGPREVARACAAGLTIHDLYVAPELIPDWQAAIAVPNAPGTLPIAFPPGTLSIATEVSARVLAKMSYRAEPEGIVAVVEAPDRSLPVHTTLVLVAVGIEKPGNLGAMARTAEAAGADALLVGDARVDPWNPNAIRASTGAVFSLPILEVELADLLALGLQRVAAVVGSPLPYTGVDLTRPSALIVGAEDAGLDPRWRAAADVQASLPMLGNTVDSLNAATASALLLYEAVRQRDARALARAKA
jgi:TrmH family RNA methyltransferase